jgi:hypothetical protein
MNNLGQWTAYLSYCNVLVATEINAIKEAGAAYETESNTAEAATDAAIAALDVEHDTALNHVFVQRTHETQTRHFENPEDFDAFFEKYRGWINAVQADVLEKRSAIYAAAKAARTKRQERHLQVRAKIEAEYQAKTKGLTFETFAK